ncbi:MAG: hypothetical protein MR481_02550 [Campylobacter sp.]|uniref:hypothetical protein n=1 Tax=Campylobacter TaxID=194 RepID=UPI00235EA43F|nr:MULTISPECIES: hypothetical protein [Campylobacter]MCI7246789.1 hypothetical protein [Campylobacter sp.]MDD0846326.1 hypothetical protein [Campylobacter magnus]MDD0855042.1 hypothetical protein [Campylobacter magnus]MDO2407601.1 hypothetical protein [Campylobacter magnus]MDY2763221.1 hypothetical protein [Campylobacter sp.]
MFKTAKTKLLALGAAVLGSASLANAAVTVGQDGAISGSLDVAPFMSGAGVVIVALGAMWAIKKVISLLR